MKVKAGFRPYSSSDAAFISKQQTVKPNIIMLKRHFTKW